MNYPTKEGYEPGKWNADLPINEHTGEIDVEGHWIGNYANYIFTDVLGFCACGMPDEVTKFIRSVLRHVANLQDEVWDDSNPKTYSEWDADGETLFNNEIMKYFMFYWLDKEGLTEHGSSVPGWLTDKGREILAKLDELGPDLELMDF